MSSVKILGSLELLDELELEFKRSSIEVKKELLTSFGDSTLPTTVLVVFPPLLRLAKSLLDYISKSDGSRKIRIIRYDKTTGKPNSIELNGYSAEDAVSILQEADGVFLEKI